MIRESRLHWFRAAVVRHGRRCAERARWTAPLVCALLATGAWAQEGGVSPSPEPPADAAPPSAGVPPPPPSPTSSGAAPTSATAEVSKRTEDNSALEAQRTPLQALNEHFLGSAARSVRYDWRSSPVMLGVLVGEVLERNNFGQWRLGAMGRKAFGDILLDGGVNIYFAYPTASSETLALTPFRQAGRPGHLEIDVNLGYAVAEGVVTPMLSFLPPAEMVLVVYAGARYLGYWETFPSRPIQDIAVDLVLPQLSQTERLRLEDAALGGMSVDPARFHVMLGVSLDVYLQPGVFVSPRVHLAVPLLTPLTGTQLGWFSEVGLAVGYAL